jgi:hypothetical protein
MSSYNKFTSAIVGLILSLATAPAWAIFIDTTVKGTSNVYFAGHTLAELDAIRIAEGTYPEALYFGDLSDPNTSPSAIDITGLGGALSISASGAWAHGADSLVGPEGEVSPIRLSRPQYGIFGVSLLEANLSMLVGVFLSDLAPIPGGEPFSLSTLRGDDMTGPLLNQGFAIGASLANIIAPTGATRLYLGLHDGFEWTNNRGSVDVRIQDHVPVAEPATLSLLGAGLLGFGLVRRKRKA